MRTNFSWRKDFESICDAVLEPIEITDLDEKHPAVAFNDYWHGLADGRMPDKSQFSPQHVPSLLKWLMLFRQEIIDGKDVYHLFLQGSSAAEMTDGLLQGQYLHEFTAEECYEVRLKHMREVLASERPAFARIHLVCHDETCYGEFSTDAIVGMFPISEGDGRNIFLLPAPESKEIRSLM